MRRTRGLPARNRGGGISEAAWQSEVMGLLAFYGWLAYHTHNSERSPAGFPDITATRTMRDFAPELLFAELKTDTGAIRPAQRSWLWALHQVAAAADHMSRHDVLEAPAIGCYLWRPRDRRELEATIAGPRGPGIMVQGDDLEHGAWPG
jgi:hypothetical protein